MGDSFKGGTSSTSTKVNEVVDKAISDTPKLTHVGFPLEKVGHVSLETRTHAFHLILQRSCQSLHLLLHSKVSLS